MSEKLFREGDGIDEKTCLQMYDNSYDFYIAVLNTFIKEIEKTITGMNEYQKKGDQENYRILVHGLKGSGASAGASYLVEMATRSNALIRDGRFDEAKKLHEPIINELERLTVLIRDRIEAFNK